MGGKSWLLRSSFPCFNEKTKPKNPPKMSTVGVMDNEPGEKTNVCDFDFHWELHLWSCAKLSLINNL